MTERGDQVQKLLSVLQRHADLVSEAFEGSVSGGDRQRDKGIEDLFQVGALKPYDEDSYRLNPRLREFFSDFFASYHAFEALRRVFGSMHQAQEQWTELRRLKKHGSIKDQDRLYTALDESIGEIAYSIEHNLQMLHALLSTQYGNVEDLSSKLRQNRYYAKQVAQFLRDVEGVGAFAQHTADQATGDGMHDVRRLVTRRLGARRLAWTAQIKDAQALISKRLFEAKLMETQLKRLSRFALWLTRHRTADGWELPLDTLPPAALVRPEGLAIKPQVDVSDADAMNRDTLLAAVARMPIRKTAAKSATEEAPQLLISDEEVALTEVEDPVILSLQDLASQAQQGDTSISLLGWKSSHPALENISDAAWLMFACIQLRATGLHLFFSRAQEPDPFAVNERFHDIEVCKSMSA